MVTARVKKVNYLILVFENKNTCFSMIVDKRQTSHTASDKK